MENVHHFGWIYCTINGELLDSCGCENDERYTICVSYIHRIMKTARTVAREIKHGGQSEKRTQQ